MIDYLLLFGGSLLAATIMPFSSEVILYSMIDRGESALLLVITATLGNTLGGGVNWYLGKYLLRYQEKKWFYFRPEQLSKMQVRFQRYGVWSLLFSWLPLVGDVLTCVAGIMKVKLYVFIPLVMLGKGIRYLGVMYLAL